ncbi:carboxypeptidase-like regulatory domain-containing protein [Fulvivirga maritima]|uniref:carboxypeptidase-like regulatory domain-containing protein n=1 Tax=Fulvivirga maritima TaxID=2904247 RepID=UPI001F283D37|nr:carboxypeptidase-like regulatory domain-containing protein [Fulvivirga maritima]UII25827.1 carboxypeptidase-like regulatory domain-containing protein [Fulvivirga maritima]
MDKLVTIIFFLLITSIGNAQIEVKGTVVSNEEEEGLGLPGVNVVELGTQNGTTTDKDGNFILTVTDPNATLEISFVGFITQQLHLNGKDSIFIKLKIDCIRDFLDARSISVYALSGIFNTPLGGKLDFALPYFSKGTLITGFSYQSDLEDLTFINGKLEYKHYIFNCDLDFDLNWYYRHLNLIDFKSSTNSFETNFNYENFRLIVGYSHLNIDNRITDEVRSFSAPVVGLGTWFNTAPFQLLLTGKVALFGNRTEVIGQATFYTKYVEFFVNYYQLDSFSELTIGIGKEFAY